MNRRPTNRAATQPRRGLDHDEAAVFVGVTFQTFDRMVAEGRLPKPVELHKRIRLMAKGANTVLRNRKGVDYDPLDIIEFNSFDGGHELPPELVIKAIRHFLGQKGTNDTPNCAGKE